eukprot:3162296-Pyramimonas_sp.AAC.1
MKWAVWSTVTSQSPTSVVAVIPRWKKGAYMNLLRHRNVRVVARYARDTFSFEEKPRLPREAHPYPK